MTPTLILYEIGVENNMNWDTGSEHLSQAKGKISELNCHI